MPVLDPGEVTQVRPSVARTVTRPPSPSLTLTPPQIRAEALVVDGTIEKTSGRKLGTFAESSYATWKEKF